MAKKKVKKKQPKTVSRKSKAVGLKKETEKSDKLVKKTAQKKLTEQTEKNIIELRKKIKLEKSSHSYRTFFERRYGKYVKRAKGPLLILAEIFGALLIMGCFFIFGVWLIFGRDLPDVGQLKKMNFNQTTRIYDRNGNVLFSIFDEENRNYVMLDQIAKNAINGTIAIEDKNFYKHFGFDIFGMIRAQMKNMQDDKITQGASTITQQLAKNIFLSPEKTYDRKIKELILAIEIELYYSKDEILEMYLNKIAYGSNAFGIEAAAQTFFGKSAKDLDLLESSILAALPKAPSTFSPYGQNKKELLGYCKSAQETINPAEEYSSQELELMEAPLDEKELKTNLAAQTEEEISTQQAIIEKCDSPFDKNYVWGRKDLVLQRMEEDGYITRDQFLQAWKEGFNVKFKDPVHRIEAPHFVFYVKELLEKKYGKEMVESGGLEVITTLDPHMQSVAEEAVHNHADYNWNNFRANNAGLVAVDPKTGQVLAMVGSVNYWDEKIDGQVNVTTSLRQPGSSFKPIVYADAIQNAGIGSGSVLSDYKTKFNKKDVPRNADNTYKGQMIVRNALAQSRNIPAIKAYYIAGEEEKILELCDKIGLTSLREFKNNFNKDAATRGWTFNYGWPMAIGSGEVRLLDLAGAYATLANSGTYMPVNPILEVRNAKGEVLEKFQAKGTQAIDPQAAYIVTDILSDASAKPAGSWRNAMTVVGHTIASKTGTSNKKVGRGIYPNNNILMGYTPSLVVGVWVGNTDGSIMRGNAWGFADAGPIWKYFFSEVLKDKPDEKFTEPEGLVHRGREIYPSWVKYKNWDAQFSKVEDTQETQQSQVVKDVPIPDFLVMPEAMDTPSTEQTIPAKPIIPQEPTIPPVPTIQQVPNGF